MLLTIKKLKNLITLENKVSPFDTLLTTIGGVGLLPGAPGTYGSIAAAIGLLFFPQTHRIEILLTLIIVLTAVSMPSIKRIEKQTFQDPSFIVIDEVIGLWITFLSPFIPLSILWISVGTVLFRFFDIIKPYPISLINKKKGAWYVIADDILAGIFACLTMQLIYMAYRIFPFIIIYFGCYNIN